MTAPIKHFITNKYPYVNYDLNDIFAPFSTDTTPVYTNYGTLLFSNTNPFSTSNYFPMANITTEGTANSFSITNQSIIIVTTGLEGNASYIQFPSTGIYNLKMAYSFKFGYDGSSGYGFKLYMRFMDANDTNETTIPANFNFNNFLEVSSNGNSGNDNGITTANPNNSLFIYNLNSNNTQGYYVFEQNFYSDSTGKAYVNIYNIDMTFNVLIPNLKIYPQYYINRNNTQSTYWQWGGNWSVTKIGLLELGDVGSLLSNGTSYASGSSLMSIAATDLYTIEFFLLINSDTSTDNYQSVLSLGSGQDCPFIKYYITATDTNTGITTNKVALDLFNSSSQIATTTPLDLNTWYHIAFTRNDTLNEFSVFLNGQLQVTTLVPNATINSNTITVASFSGQPSYPTLKGNITNIRITKKVVYIGNFTVPQVPLQVTQAKGINIAEINDGECISLLQCYENYPFLDAVSGNNFTNSNLVYSYMKP
jgi:hypothetical protein